MVATAVTLNDLEGHSPVADVFTCNPSNICAAFYTISTDSVLARSSASAELLVYEQEILCESELAANECCAVQGGCDVMDPLTPRQAKLLSS